MEGRPIKIAIEGNIAAGKSSFLDLVNKHTNFKTQQVAISNLQLNPHPVIDRDMISGLTGTGTGTEIINLPGPGPIISILPGPGPTIQFDRDDQDMTRI